ncbi:MAG: hypothetical protein QOE55_8003 [Acidobacteriaceae bacterium]|jgi:hypothetical protein|nr:hypothetical protein [Acidobacteriaceae bacterium]
MDAYGPNGDLEERTSGAKALVIVGPYGPTEVVP